MEQFKSFVIENWPTILEYVFMFIAYFLIMLYRSKVGTTKRDLSILFKEKTQEITERDKALRTDIDTSQNNMQKELEESKAAYQAAVNKIRTLERNTEKLTEIIAILIAEEVTEDA